MHASIPAGTGTVIRADAPLRHARGAAAEGMAGYRP